MSQTSYAEQAAAIMGMLGDTTDGPVKTTALNGEASAELPFGYMTQRFAAMTGTTPNVAKALAGGTDDLLGVIIHSHEYDKRLDLGTLGVLPKRQLNILEKGRIWVPVDVAVAVTDTVWVRFTVNGTQLVGMFSNATDGGKCRILYGAKFLTSTTAAGMALVEVDMPAHRAAYQAKNL